MPLKKDIVKRPPKTIKEKKFVKAYLETGNATTATLVAGYDTTPKVARNIGSQNLAKLDISSVMEKAGITDDLLMEGLKEGLQAYKRSTSLTEPDSIDPDFGVRHKYWTSAATMKNWLKQDGDKPGDTYNQVFIGWNQ